MRIGVIGPGRVGTTLGQGFTRAGHQVVYGARDESRTAPHAGALIDTVGGAVQSAELLVLTTPWASTEAALGAAGDFEGKVLIDATNPAAGALHHTASGGEKVAQLAKNARVVKGFNAAAVETLGAPRAFGGRAAAFFAGDDPDAVSRAVALGSECGFDAVGLDGLWRARDLEPLAALRATLTSLGQDRRVAFGLARRTAGSAEVTATISALRPTSAKQAIVVVGGGRVGGALARGWVAAGHDVRVALRDPNTEHARELVAFGASVGALDDAATDADVVVLAVPSSVVAGVLPRLGDLQGKIVVDCTNEIGAGATLGTRAGTSSPEQIAHIARGARLVRAFNQQGVETLTDARFDDRRAVSFVASDDAEARAAVAALSGDLSLDTVDAGSLANARLLDHLAIVWLAASQAIGTRSIGLTLLRP